MYKGADLLFFMIALLNFISNVIGKDSSEIQTLILVVVFYPFCFQVYLKLIDYFYKKYISVESNKKRQFKYEISSLYHLLQEKNCIEENISSNPTETQQLIQKDSHKIEKFRKASIMRIDTFQKLENNFPNTNDSLETNHINRIEIEFNQLLEKYPNNAYLLILYAYFEMKKFKNSLKSLFLLEKAYQRSKSLKEKYISFYLK